VDAVREPKIVDRPAEALLDPGEVEGRLHRHVANARSRGVPASALDFLIFS
jgi:hypothetical protein